MKAYVCNAFPFLRVGHLEFNNGLLVVERDEDARIVEASELYGAFIHPRDNDKGTQDPGGPGAPVPPASSGLYGVTLGGEVLTDGELHSMPTPDLERVAKKVGWRPSGSKKRHEALRAIAEAEVKNDVS